MVQSHPRIPLGHGRHSIINISSKDLKFRLLHWQHYARDNFVGFALEDISPPPKITHTVETFHLPVCPHFLMELHVSLCCAVPNSRWLEYIPQLDDLTSSRLKIIDGMAQAPNTPGIGIEWDLEKVKKLSKLNFQI